MIFEHISYRTYLKEVLADRTSKNSQYSLRAMARQLGFAPSSLSEVMKGTANFSLTSARKLASKLGLPPKEAEYLYLLVQYESTKDAEIKETLFARMKNLNPSKTQVHDLSIDQFRQISEWYHSAILEMVDLHHFVFSPVIIAKRLGISKVEVEVAIDRLIRLDLLEKTKKGEIVRIHDQLITKSNAADNQALRKFFKQMLHKAGEALETQSPKERVSGYETLAIPPEGLDEAREITEKYFNEMIALGNKYPKKKNVYHLLVHFFNLTDGKV
jgi:uncharacterized protein (TIGR02147 family)